ncbi:MAG TPA: HD domain-containing phosphohydrolase [Nitrospirales bacterium]|nr:HD domain-containing phosphohydrolase [Nitrospirales bacterium]
MAQSGKTKPTILIVEDEAGPRDALRMILRPFFNLIAVDRAGLALEMLREHPIDLVTLDLKLPDKQGVDLLQEIKAEYPDIEVIIITGYGSLKSAMEGIQYGAAGYLLKPFNVTELISVVNQTLTKRRRLTALKQFLASPSTQWTTDAEVAQNWKRLMQDYAGDRVPRADGASEMPDWTPLVFELLEAKGRALFNHSSRVSFYAGMLGKAIGVTDEEQKTLAFGSFLHDIGMLAHEGPELEWPDDCRSDLRRHPELGARMIAPLQLPAEVGQIISYHHERYDGTGSPFGLQGAGIPLLARIVHIAETFDHLVSDTPALSTNEALEQIRSQAGIAFDPTLIEAFIKVMRAGEVVMPPVVPSMRPSASRRA